jgi:hypothetical protein
LAVTAAPFASATDVSIRTLDGSESVGRLVSFSLADGLEWQPPDGNMARLETEQVVSITARGRTAKAPAEGAVVHLAGGGRLIGHLRDGDEEALVLESPTLGRVRLPFEQVAAIVTERGRRELPPSTVRAALRTTRRDADALWFANGDRLSGSLLLITASQVRVETELGVSQASTEFLWGVFLAGVSDRPPNEKLRAWLRLVDSAELPADSMAWLGQNAQVAAGDWLETSFPSLYLVSVEVLGGRWRWLGELVPTEYTQTSMAGVQWPYSVDANVLDGPLRLKGRTYTRGLGLHGAASLGYYLGGEYEAFKAVVGIDDSAGPFADADFEIRVDSRTAFRARGLRMGGDPVTVSVNIAGAQRLQIAVDFGRNGDIQDRVNLADAALIRKRTPSTDASTP